MIKASINVSGALRVAKTATKQIRYAAARALTEAARDYDRVATVLMRQTRDRPTPFSQRAVRSRGANASNLQARVFVMPIQAAYLAPHVDGGTVSASKPSPTPIAENKDGTLPRGTT